MYGTEPDKAEVSASDTKSSKTKSLVEENLELSLLDTLGYTTSDGPTAPVAIPSAPSLQAVVQMLQPDPDSPSPEAPSQSQVCAALCRAFPKERASPLRLCTKDSQRIEVHGPRRRRGLSCAPPPHLLSL